MHREYLEYKTEYTHFRTKKHHRMRWLFAIIMAVIFGCALYVLYLAQSPRVLVYDTVVTIEEGMTVRDAAEVLEEQHIIRSKTLFELLVQIHQSPIIAGDYLFEDPHTVLQVAQRLTVGQYGDVRIRVILQEGMSREQMAEILEDELPKFDDIKFLEKTMEMEGYLYPDTYFFFPSVTTEEVVTKLHTAFLEKTQQLETDFLESEYSRDDIITMASIIEKEATTNSDERAIISGILWKRIEKNMAMQVDAPFVYALVLGSHDLTIEDLRRDSPYNTYTNKGLPPTPIGNPSIGSIVAALHPKDSPYLFYLHGSDRRVHYAETHAGHVNNKRNYLD